MGEVHAARRMRLRDWCATAGRSAALVSRMANVRYLSGASPPGSALLLAPCRDVLVLCPEPLGAFPESLLPDDLERMVLPSAGQDPVVAAASAAAGLGADTLAIEEHDLTVGRYRAIERAATGMRLTDLSRAVEQLRLVKEENEIAALRVAAELADQALGELLESILVGRTERHLALELERRLVDHGAEAAAFPTQVGTGPNAGAPAHIPTDRRVEEGDFLSVCLGACYDGYRARVGRTFVIGTEPSSWQIDVYDLLFTAQRAGREALLPGSSCRDVDRAARQVVEGAGYGDRLGPFVGQGVGLENDEDPQLSPAAMGKLDACVPVTVEPGVHFPGRGGVRISDTLVVRSVAEGGPELLTITTKELLAL